MIWRAIARARSVGLGIVVVIALTGAGCDGPILAVPPVERPAPPAPSAGAPPPADPVPIAFPRDDGPHDRLTEWWYYTGHLADASGGRYGFELVVFRAERGDFPVSWASHLAITDEGGQRFLYAQRSQVGPTVDVSPMGASGPTGFGFRVEYGPTRVPGHPAWEMEGRGGSDRLSAFLSPAEALAAGSPGSAGIDLGLSTDRDPVLHDKDGFIDFGPSGGSYYYSRTRMTAAGTLTLDGASRPVEGSAWFDHQWGDFIAIGGGWDWFAINLDDGTDLTVSIVRDTAGTERLAYGTLVDPDGPARHVPGEALTVTTIDRWTSPASGGDYPAGWTIAIPPEGLVVDLRPTVADQELDTRATTGVIYWEGSADVRATRDARPVAGLAYVELTGYASGD